jgi:O-antigen/teichoic acid export membrane protein
MVIMVAATLTLVFLSSFLIPLFYGDVFLPSVNAVKILAVGTFFCSQAQIFGHFLGARNMNWVNTIVYGIALLVLGVSGFVFIPVYGIEGAALASGASYFVMFCVFCGFVKIKHNVSLLSLFIITRSDIDRGKSIFNRITKKSV